MARQEAKPPGPRAAGRAAAGRRRRSGQRRLGRAGGKAACSPVVGCSGPARAPRTTASRNAPPPPPPPPLLLLGLLLLAALPEPCRTAPGTGHLQTTGTPTPEPFAPGKLLPMSPTWPFSEVPSPGPRPRTVLAPVDNGSAPQQQLDPAVQFPPSSLQRSGQSSAAPGPPLDPATLLQPRPLGGQAAAPSGWPPTSMQSPEPNPRAALPSPPSRAATPSVSSRPSSVNPELLSPFRTGPSPAVPCPSSPSKPEPVSSPEALPDPSSLQKVAQTLNPFADQRTHRPPWRTRLLRGTLGLGDPRSSEELSWAPSPILSRGHLTPQFGPTPVHLSPHPQAPANGLSIWGGTPFWPMSGDASNPASRGPAQAEVAPSGPTRVSLTTLKHSAAGSHQAQPTLSQMAAESVVVEMSSRKRPTATAKDSAHSLPLSAVPENSKGPPALSAERTLSSLVTSLPLTKAGPGQTPMSGAGPGPPWDSAGAAVSSARTSLQQPQDLVSPLAAPPMPTPREEDSDRAPPTAATDVPLSSRFPKYLSTMWTLAPQEEESETVTGGKKQRANLTIRTLQSLPSGRMTNLHAANGLISDFSTDPTSPAAVLAHRGSLLPSELPSLSLSSRHATQTLSSNTRLETPAAARDHSALPGPASKQVTAVPSSAEGYDFSTMGVRKKPAITDVFWSSFSAGPGSLSPEPMKSGSPRQTNDDFNGPTINSTSSETHSASATPPPSFTSAASTINFEDFNDAAGHFATTEGFSMHDSVPGTSTNQPAQQSDVPLLGDQADILSTSNNNASRNFQPSEFEESPSTSSVSHSLASTHPFSLTSPGRPSSASWQDMLSDGMDTTAQFVRNTFPSPVINDATVFQGITKYHSTTTESPLSNNALFRTPSKELLAPQRPRKGTGAAINAVDSSVPSKAEPTAASAPLFLRKASPPALSAALVAKGTGSSLSASGLVKSSLTAALVKNVTSSVASSPKVTPGTVYPAFSFTPTYMFARTSHTMSAHTAMPGNTGAALGLVSTTLPPRKPQAMHTGLPNPTPPGIPRGTTTRSLTITAALTSITAPGRATRLPPVLAENTDTALPAVSTAVVTTGKITSNLECQMSSKLLVKTVLFVTQRRMQISESLRLNVAKGLTQALRKAFHQNDISAHVDILEHSHNVTVGYYATKGRLVYLPAVVMEMLSIYGISNVTADLKQHTPNLQSVAVLASPWNAQPAGYFQLKTVLQFVSQSDNIQSCKFAQTMEHRLQKAFQDAERKVLNTKSNLTIQIVSTSNASQTVTLVYVVGNRSSFLNGTVASSLLRQLSAELVGFYLTYPPLTIAEPLEYPNLDISETTRDYWVITVLQGVDNSLVGLHNQSFARVMEQRLAQLFMMSQQQGRRFKRATTLGSYTVQMVKMQRVPGPKDPAELTYYTLYNGKPLLGTAAAKILSTIDSQRMALTLHHVVLLQADPVVKNPPNNLWIIAAVLAPIAVVTVIIIIITAVLCRKNKNDFKPDTMMNLPQRAKPVQGFDYAKQHLGQQGADEEVVPVTQETVVLPLPARDAPTSQERDVAQDGSTIKTAKSTETRKSRSPSENGSVLSNESGKPSTGRRSPQNVMAQQKVTKEEARKRNVPASDDEEGVVRFDNGKATAEPFDATSGSVQLIAVKPTALPVVHPTSDRSQEPAVLNGEVNKALKQKSDIEHYRNKLRLKAKRKGYYDFPPVEANKAQTERKKMYEKAPKDVEHVLDPDPELCAPFTEAKNRQQMKNSVYRSRQSLNSPSPGETEMDLLVTRERPRRGIRNSGYDTEPEIIEETNIDRVNESRGYSRSRQVKGHSETSTLSSQPSIDEVRQQMHLLLEEAFSLASSGHAGQSRHPEVYGSTQHLPYSEVVTSAPGTMTRPRAGVQWVPTYRPEMYQYSLPRPAYRFSQLPEMVMGSPPPPVPPRTGPVAVTSLRRSTSDVGSKTRMTDSTGPEAAPLHDSGSFAQVSRGQVSVAQLDQSALNYSGNTVPAVFAIPAANRPGFTGYFIPTPPSSYRNQAWMSYAGENELPSQWADSVPLPGYIEAYPRSRYQQSSPSRLHRQYSQPSSMHPSLEQGPVPSTAASQQSLTENDPPDTPLTNISTAALVKAIREEVAKLAKKQTDMFEFQV
ncbi:UPF0606 protein KIAA1549L homolog [Sorex fumeus]|uniref:UPF0606 protein KIAA1549L homolog n=1 Tax=Sorex fumeus TaxID=62283 RepID=UPI0024ACD5A5|nr:UPF0606 protein KIAA1549L homolog [Sorex fumeus]